MILPNALLVGRAIRIAKTKIMRPSDGDAEDNVNQKLNLYFTYESHNTLMSFTSFLTVKTVAELNPKQSDKLKKKKKKTTIN